MAVLSAFEGMTTSSQDLILNSWLRWATNAYEALQEDYNRFDDYYHGDHVLEFATDRWKSTFGTLFEQFADNWCEVVVDSLIDRLEIIGWDSDDEATSKWAGEFHAREEIDDLQNDVHTGSTVKGDGYLMCWYDPDDEATAHLYYNDALDINFSYETENFRLPHHASKKYHDEEGSLYMWLYFNDASYQFEIKSTESAAVAAATNFAGTPAMQPILPSGWKWVQTVDNPYNTLPVIHFKNRGAGDTHGQSELKVVVPIQNAVNKTLMDMMLGSEFGSFRQKYMTGGGHPRDGWRAGPERVWATTDPNAKFGEFAQTDLEPIIRGIELLVSHIGKLTQTPMHYLRTSGDMPSGEALKTAESGLVQKAFRRQRQFGARWTQAMAMAYQIEHNGKKPPKPINPIWKNPATRHDLEQAQVVQLKAILGIPLEVLWAEHFGYTQEQIDDFKEKNGYVATQTLAQVLAQTGQLPPGMELQDVNSLDLPQLLSMLPKAITSQTAAGEARTNPQPNTRPPGSPTRRSSGFDRGVRGQYD